jgi:hypothetical protein
MCRLLQFAREIALLVLKSHTGAGGWAMILRAFGS